MNSQTTVYGRAAYEGFAKAIGSKLGLSVQVDDGATACINANGTIKLPGMSTYQTAHQFAITCGTIVHELAHQFYGSHRLIDPKRDRLEHDCLNAVLDVADETWIDKWFIDCGNGRPGELLTQGNADAINTNSGALQDWSNPNTHAWKVLCIGILSARLGKRLHSSWRRYAARYANKHGVDAKACFRLLLRARRAKDQNPTPTVKRFRKLKDLACKLADLLKPFAPPPGAAGSLSPLDAALAQGQSEQPDCTQLATEADGEKQSTGPVAIVGGSGNGSGGTEEFDSSSFALLFPAAERIAERIATDGEGLYQTDGLASGPCIGEAHRLLTDGLCLSRWSSSDNADGVAVSVLLDCSGSMRDQRATCAGIARAFAQAMRSAGPVQSLVFGDSVRKSDDFATVRDMGGTETHLAVEQASDWLITRPGKRWIVLITDGAPNDRYATDAAIRTASAAGIRTLAIGLGCNLRMPAECVTASDAAHLAIELDAAGRRIECGA